MEGPMARNGKASGGATPLAMYTIQEFCRAHAISRGFFHKLQRGGMGPRLLRLGHRVFVTFEAAAEWRAERENATQDIAS
jgi:hypothetical protein